MKASAQQIKRLFDELRLITCGIDIGEALTAHILNYVVQNYARESCITCRRFPEGCPKSDVGRCDDYSHDAEAEAEARVHLYDALFMLDGVYCFNAGETVSVVTLFLAELKKQDA